VVVSSFVLRWYYRFFSLTISTTCPVFGEHYKLLAVRSAFDKGFDFVAWADCDSLYLPTDLPFCWQPFGTNWDGNGVCMSHFVLSKIAYHRQLIDTLLFLGDVKDASFFGIGDKWEQNSFKALLQHFKIHYSLFPKGTVILSESDANETTEFFHYPGTSVINRYQLMKRKYEAVYS
jgi:hypothetical protein